MTNKDVALKFAAKWQAADMNSLAAMCTDDFLFSGPIPTPLNIKDTIGMIGIMKTAAPDINYHTTYVNRDDGNIVHMTNQLSGTHTGKLDLTNFGMGIIPPTGKSFSMPVETVQVSIKGEKVASYHVDARPDAGISGILAALGISGAQA